MMYVHPTSTKVSVQPPNPKINQTIKIIKIIKVFDFFEFFIVLYYNLKSRNGTHTHTHGHRAYYIRLFLVASFCSRPCVLMYFEFQIIKIFKVDFFLINLINYGLKILCYGQTHFYTHTRTL